MNWNEMILSLMKTVMGDRQYEEFMELFCDRSLKERTITLPSYATLEAQRKKDLVDKWGNLREERKKIYLRDNSKAKKVPPSYLRSHELSWDDAAIKSDYSSGDEARKQWHRQQAQIFEWFKMGYVELLAKCVHSGQMKVTEYQIKQLIVGDKKTQTFKKAKRSEYD
jgi:hypothetical protein